MPYDGFSLRSEVGMRSPQDFFSRETALRGRALAVLGFDVSPDGPPPLPDRRELRYRYHCRMLKHHPDANMQSEASHRAAMLINEAFALLSGRIVQPSLLLDDALVQSLLDDPVTPLDGVPSYDDWLKEQFFNVDGKSIWSY